MVHNKTSYSPE